jgi:hypothetical protein
LPIDRKMINKNLNLKGLRREFSRDSRVRIEGLLDDDVAEKVAGALLHQTLPSIRLFFLRAKLKPFLCRNVKAVVFRSNVPGNPSVMI